MSAKNIESWKNIHDVDQRILNFFETKSNFIGRAIINNSFSKTNYIRALNNKKVLFTKIHNKLSELFPDVKIIVRLPKSNFNLIEITIYDQQVGMGTELRSNKTRAVTPYTYFFDIKDLDKNRLSPYYEQLHNGEYLRVYEIVKRVVFDIIQESKMLIKSSLEKMALRLPRNNNKGGLTYQRYAKQYNNNAKQRRTTRKRRN